MIDEELKKNYLVISTKRDNMQKELKRTKQWLALIEQQNPNIKEAIKNGK